jgi:hypothetical protein
MSWRRSSGRERNLGYVVILSIGRSGSTLVQGILNSIGDYLIRGENDNACHRLIELTASLERRREQHRPTRRRPVDRPEHAWYGIMDFDPDAFVASCRRLVQQNILPWAQSGWWKDATGDPIEYITRMQDRLVTSAFAAPAPTHIVDYESFVDDPVKLRGLFEFLGERFHEESVRLVMSRRHSY